MISADPRNINVFSHDPDTIAETISKLTQTHNKRKVQFEKHLQYACMAHENYYAYKYNVKTDDHVDLQTMLYVTAGNTKQQE